MKVPISWLKEYLDFSLSAEGLAEVLTLAGIEVDGIERTALKFSGVVVGEVIEAHRHPNADHLWVAKVADGKEILQVVCGAPNCRAGIKTAFARIGASLQDEQGSILKIKKCKLRDVESFGMLCAADELGIGEQHEGIVELSPEAAVGSDVAELYSEIVLEVSLTPNLGHCMSIYGLARELSALLNIPLKIPSFSFAEEGESIDKCMQVTVIDHRQCPRYACRIVKGIRVGPSPEWLKKRIEVCGMRSINNVVDVSNLVLLEWGQPLHIFNYDAIAQKKIIVNSQTAFSVLETLDDVVRPIPPESLLICDAEKPLAFAGVMGGKSSAVSEQTQDVLIESAYFTAQAIRKSSKWLGLRTEAAQRYEKGINPNGVKDALNYAAYRLQQVAGGQIAPGVIDQKAHEFLPKKIACRIARVNALLGTQLSLREVASLLERLSMSIEERQSELIVSVPTYRNDVSIEEDLIEEIARLYGYNQIQKPIPVHVSSTIPPAQSAVFENAIRQRLIAEGLQEFLNCDLISPAQEEMLFESTLSKESCISVLHAKSAEQSVLRTSLLPGLLQVVKYNSDHYQRDIAGCEVGRVYFKQNGAFKEQAAAGIILSGKRAPYHWDPKPEECDFFDLKGIVENILTGLKIERFRFDPSHLHNFHPGRQAHVKIGDAIIGVMGEVHPKHIEKLDIGQKVLFAEWNLNELFLHLPEQKMVTDPPLYPGSERDWTVTLKEELPIQAVFTIIQRASSRLLEKVSLLDLYKSEQIGKDKKNATFRFFYRDTERTLAFETVEREHARIIQAITDSL